MFSASLPAHQLADAMSAITTVNDGTLRQIVMPPIWRKIPMPANRRFQRAQVVMHRFVEAVISDRRADDIDRGDMLPVLLGAALSSAQLSDDITNFFGAAYESTASTLAWALHLLSGHPEIEHRLHAEVDTVLAGAPARYEHLPRLELTRRVITETLRIRPIAWIMTRIVSTDTELGGYSLPAGTTVVFSPYLIHHRRDLYEDPDRFDPDRQLSERDGALIPFGGGARKCMGDQFAMVEMTLALAAITSRWRLRTLPGTSVRPSVSLVSYPEGLRMRASLRMTDSLRNQSAVPGSAV
jgi:cytochrome P450